MSQTDLFLHRRSKGCEISIGRNDYAPGDPGNQSYATENKAVYIIRSLEGELDGMIKDCEQILETFEKRRKETDE